LLNAATGRTTLLANCRRIANFVFRDAKYRLKSPPRFTYRKRMAVVSLRRTLCSLFVSVAPAPLADQMLKNRQVLHTCNASPGL
jgi:hypothetical protein